MSCLVGVHVAYGAALELHVTTDGTLATLAAARDAIRELKKAGPLPAGSVTVIIHGGTYFLDKTFELTKEDSGTADSPIVYRAAGGEHVRILGGLPITGFVPYRGQILKADVGKQGFKGVYFRQLLLDSQRQTLARWPNVDPQDPHGGRWAYADGKRVPLGTVIAGESLRSFQYRPQDARTWSRPAEAEVFVFSRPNWDNNIIPVANIDRATRTITLTKDASYAIRPGNRYFVQNQLEELDSPGEWYLDRDTATLYYWPPEPLAGKTVYAPIIGTLISLGREAAYVTVSGLELTCCESTAVLLTEAHDCLIAGNSIHDVGGFRGVGVRGVGGRHNGVVGNDIHHTGSGAISLHGGDRRTLTQADHYADNNYVHHTGVYGKGTGAISLSGVGNRASHNLIHDCPRFGISFVGNLLEIEYNHIHHVNLETEDTGAVYTGGARDWIASRGSRVCFNFIHDAGGYGEVAPGRWALPYNAFGIYLDGTTCGVEVGSNIIARTARGAVFVHNGRNNQVVNNICVDGAASQLACSGWGESTWEKWLPGMYKAYETLSSEPAWKAMPGMETHPRDILARDKFNLADNRFERNVFCYTSPKARLFKLPEIYPDRNTWDYNLAWHNGQPLAVVCGARAPMPNPVPDAKHQDTPTDRWPQWWQARGMDLHSIVADPLFIDPAKDDFRLKPESPAFKLGFKPIPVEKIGPFAAPLRATWPIVEARGMRERMIKESTK